MNPLWLKSVITSFVLCVFSLVSLSSHFLLSFSKKVDFYFGKIPKMARLIVYLFSIIFFKESWHLLIVYLFSIIFFKESWHLLWENFQNGLSHCVHILYYLSQRKWTFTLGKFPRWLICSLRSTYSGFHNWKVYWIKWRIALVV